ncbi:Transient receptor potential cation channel subfamily A member 1 -like protein [Toxocara canis]|uniref:Transient receptor potential cation channel subfamily A member 1-like protein n=1 Tax=Toxocara canis TaxID=6265 RepID=A0A0B2UQQ0_TOXCA|nr:Transient receptor potential cation channel subfamily A member 1 -like protein [Toxocara canis]
MVLTEVLASEGKKRRVTWSRLRVRSMANAEKTTRRTVIIKRNNGNPASTTFGKGESQFCMNNIRISDHEAEECKLMDADDSLNPRTREFYNSRTRKIQTDELLVYLFKYGKDSSDDSEEVITWRELKDLKDRKQWAIIRHPMVLNFVNEKLLQRAKFYMAHIIAYLLFLLLLSSYIFDKNALQDVLATLFLIVFGFCLVVKGAVKLQAGKVSKWFIASYLFNIVTYIATFLFIWTPQLFSYSDYNRDLKHFITWFLPIIAIISAWINFLYILRKSPYGIYILMMTRILYSFSQIAIIWVPTLLAFAFAFHLVMRNSGTEPWEASDAFAPNATFARKLLAILQAITKTSTMMIGEVDADNVLERKEWIPNLLLLAFEITTVILLMNLMISLAVGDVNELRHSAQAKLLEIKVTFAIEALQLAETCDCLPKINLLHRQSTNNVLVLDYDGQAFSTHKTFDFGDDNIGKSLLGDSTRVATDGSMLGRRGENARPEPGFLKRSIHPIPLSFSGSEQSHRYEPNETVETNYSSSATTATTAFYSTPKQLNPLSKASSIYCTYPMLHLNSFWRVYLDPHRMGEGGQFFFFLPVLVCRTMMLRYEQQVFQVYNVHFSTGERRIRLERRSIRGRTVQVTLDGAVVQLIEGVDSGIEIFDGIIEGRRTNDVGADPEGLERKFARWLIGLDWSSLLEL